MIFLYRKDEPSKICSTSNIRFYSSYVSGAQLVSGRVQIMMKPDFFSGFLSVIALIVVHDGSILLFFIHRSNENYFVYTLHEHNDFLWSLT